MTPGVLVAATGAAQVDVPRDEADHLGLAHVLGGQVEVLLHHREVVIVGLLAGLDPADHAFCVAVVGLSDQRNVQDLDPRFVHQLHRPGDQLEVLVGPWLNAVLQDQRVRRLDQLQHGLPVLGDAQRIVDNLEFHGHGVRLLAVGGDCDVALV